MQRLVLSSIMAVLIAACDEPTTPFPDHVVGPPNFALIEQIRVDATGIVVHNECNGEDVLLTQGTFNAVVTQSNDVDLSLHQTTAAVRGIGLSTGQEYIYRQTDRLHDALTFDPGAGTFTLSLTLRFITPGSAEDEAFTFIISGTANANGVITRERIDSGTLICS